MSYGDLLGIGLVVGLAVLVTQSKTVERVKAGSITELEKRTNRDLSGANEPAGIDASLISKQLGELTDRERENYRNPGSAVGLPVSPYQ